MIDKRQPILTARVGRNAAQLSDILNLHLSPEPYHADILDMTYNRGKFWVGILEHPDIAIRLRKLWRSDVLPYPDVEVLADCRHSPFRDESFDAVIFDPPYANLSSTQQICGFEEIYGLTPIGSVPNLWALYRAGISEATRVIKSRGLVIVKCQDAIDCGRQWWTHIEIYEIALTLGLQPLDLFVLVRHGRPMMRHARQLHARRNHSYWWVFRKPKGKQKLTESVSRTVTDLVTNSKKKTDGFRQSFLKKRSNKEVALLSEDQEETKKATLGSPSGS